MVNMGIIHNKMDRIIKNVKSSFLELKGTDVPMFDGTLQFNNANKAVQNSSVDVSYVNL